jgi:hypothetical protein
MKPRGSAILNPLQLERSVASVSARAARKSLGAWMGLAGARACDGGWLRRATCEPVERVATKDRDELIHELLPSFWS